MGPESIEDIVFISLSVFAFYSRIKNPTTRVIAIIPLQSKVESSLQ